MATESSALSTGTEKVKIGFYMESMCPGCKYFTTKVLKELMAKPDFVKMVDFTVRLFMCCVCTGGYLTWHCMFVFACTCYVCK